MPCHFIHCGLRYWESIQASPQNSHAKNTKNDTVVDNPCLNTRKDGDSIKPYPSGVLWHLSTLSSRIPTFPHPVRLTKSNISHTWYTPTWNPQLGSPLFLFLKKNDNCGKNVIACLVCVHACGEGWRCGVDVCVFVCVHACVEGWGCGVDVCVFPEGTCGY